MSCVGHYFLQIKQWKILVWSSVPNKGGTFTEPFLILQISLWKWFYRILRNITILTTILNQKKKNALKTIPNLNDFLLQQTTTRRIFDETQGNSYTQATIFPRLDPRVFLIQKMEIQNEKSVTANRRENMLWGHQNILQKISWAHSIIGRKTFEVVHH